MDRRVRIEGIRPTAGGWVVVGTRPGASVVPGRSPRVPVLVAEFHGKHARREAIRAAGTDREVTGTARDTIEATR